MHHRAYALPLVMALLLLLSASLSTALLGVQGSQLISESSVHRRQAFHNAEGVGVAVVELASQKLRTLPMEPPVPRTDPGYKAALIAMLASQQEETNAFITDNAASFQTPKYVVERAQIGNLLPAQLQLLGSGPFQGMQAQVQQFSIEVAVLREHERTPARQSVVASVERATMSMFQFYVFADGYLDLDPGGPVVTSGRIHANGDFCVAGEPIVGTVTSAERILVSNNSNGHRECRRRAGEGRGANGIQVLTDDFGTFKELPVNFDHTAPNWASEALTRYNGHLRDRAHGVAALRMPLSGNPVVQAGANVLAMESVSSPGDDSRLLPVVEAKEDNTKSMRFLVDPMLQGEPADVRRQKLAFKADIRIIDGVWFLRDPLAPELPGTPIWSDHPGGGDVGYFDDEPVKIKDTIINDVTAVGQEDLRTLWTWPVTPQHFSYYGFTVTGSNEYKPAKTSLDRAVVSYGLLHNIGGSVWNPGHYATSSGPALPTDSSPGTIKTADTAQALLDGARSGFKDGWLEVRSEQLGVSDTEGRSDVETKRSRLLPINFDIAGLSKALQTCTRGELGFHFPGTCNNSSGRRFNGVVYIASTWPGSMDGLGSTPTGSSFAVLSPFHNEAGDPNPELPTAMCATTARAFEAPITTPVRTCATTARKTQGGRVRGAFANVVRVFNGALVSPPTTRSDYAGVTIRANLYPQGLTIATNLPIIALGHINTETTPRDEPFSPIPATDHFVPVLLAGDRFYRHSVNWRDELSNWRQPLNKNARVGKATTQHIEILAGWNPTPVAKPGGHDHSSDGFEDFPRYNECWSEEARFRGSIVVAFASVFTRSGANNAAGHGDGAGYLGCFPPRNEGFDFHLQDPTNQPPGAPLIVAQSVGFWQAR